MAGRPAEPREARYLRSARLSYAANGIQGGVYTLLLADLARALRLSGTELGVALATLSATSIVGVLVMGRLSDRVGRRPVLVVGYAGVAAFYAMLSIVASVPALIACMAFGGLAFSAFDLAPTTLAGDLERRHGRPLMTRLYAFLDGSVAIGALAAGVALSASVGYEAIYVALAVLLALFAAAASRMALAPTWAADSVEPDSAHASGGAGPLGAGVVLGVVLVGLIEVQDAAMEGYVSVYLRDDLGSGALLAAAGVAAAQIASGVGRLGGAALVNRHGERRVLGGAGTGSAVGIVGLVATTAPAVAAIGLLGLRMTASPVKPLGLSIAARSAPRRSGEAASLAWGASYAAFLVTPLAIGVAADLVGLRAALAGCIATSLAVVACAAVGRRALR